MKTYSAIALCLALAGTSAISVAEMADPSSGEGQTHPSGHTVESSDSQSQSAIWAMDPDDMEGKDIMDSNGVELGDVDEVVVDKSNRRMVVIGLEDSTKEVVVPIDSLTIAADGDTFTSSMTRVELEALPDYDPMDLESVDQ